MNAKTTNGGALFSTGKKNRKENVKYSDGSLDEKTVWMGAAFDEEVGNCDMRIGVCFGDWKHDYRYETDQPNDAVEWAAFENISLRTKLKTDMQIKPDSAHSATLATSIIQIDLMSLEIFGGRQVDWETAVTLKDTLGDKVALDGTDPALKKSSLTAGALLRKAVAATEVVEDTPGRNKRVTKEELKAVVDTLVSRGYLKILTNPTIQVLSGKTAKVRSAKASSITEDSFEVTPRVLDDGYIDLQTRVVLDEKFTPADQNSLLLVTKRELSGTFRIGSGASCIAGGIEKSVKRRVVGDNPETLEERTTEVLLVLTATIIDAPSNPQPKSDVQVKGAAGKDDGRDKERAADSDAEKRIKAVINDFWAAIDSVVFVYGERIPEVQVDIEAGRLGNRT